jgi:hypothetical protein
MAPLSHTITATWFDTCFVDYLTDHRGILIGIQRNGQTREELIDEVTDAAYEDDDFEPLGDHVYALLREAVAAEVPKTVNDAPGRGPFRFWPLDANGRECSDEERDEPADEQPSAWFRVSIESTPLRVKLTNNGGEDDGSVLVTCDDKGGAEDDQYIDGSTWESPSDMQEAYTILQDRPMLYDELVAAGYDVDTSEYSPPDEQDMRYWHAVCLASNEASPQELREAMKWDSLAQIATERRVQDAMYAFVDESTKQAYLQACWEAGLPLDAREWKRRRGQ